MPKQITASKNALRTEDSVTSVCLRAMFNLFDRDWLNWEPETLWLELSRQGVSVGLGNRSQILAGRNLLLTGNFWYDAQAFEATAVAINNDNPTYHGMEEAPICYLNWAVFEANLIHQEYEEEVLEFDREPISYTAVQLYREGFVIPPPMLDMAADELCKKLPESSKKLAKTIRQAWADAPRGDKLKNAAYPETPEGVQLLRLAAVQVYFDDRLQLRNKQLALLAS